MKQERKNISRTGFVCGIILSFCLMMGCRFNDTPHDFIENSEGSSQPLADNVDENTEVEVPKSETVKVDMEAEELETEEVEEAVEKGTTWDLIWHDEFEGESLDLSKWSYQIGNGYNGWGNLEAQYYTDENVFLEDGMLVIEARKENLDGCEYSSGRIRTMTDDKQVLFSTQYGKIEARISMPVGEGLWPAFWMMPVDDAYGLWPLSGEIDIVEARGRIKDEVNGSIHFGERIPNNKRMASAYSLENSDISEFHVYAVEWNTNEIKWLVDGEVYYQTSSWYTVGNEGVVQDYPAPFDKPFYLLLNLAVGGTYDEGVLPKEKELPAQMKVDYVRVYKSRQGYEPVSEKKKMSEMDVDSFQQFEEVENYIFDEDFLTATMETITSRPEYEKHTWYFLSKNHINGSGTGELVKIDGEKYFHCNIDSPGEKRYALQLQHVVPLVKGYTYVVEFEAKADAPRSISLQPIGIKDEEVVSYYNNFDFELKEEMDSYYCSFTMKDETDLEGILEFNLGLEDPDVTIGRIKVRVLHMD